MFLRTNKRYFMKPKYARCCRSMYKQPRLLIPIWAATTGRFIASGEAYVDDRYAVIGSVKSFLNARETTENM